MAGFQSPNYTQVPNELFDIYMKDMGEAELKVTLAIIRQTLGWQRKRVTFSIGNITRLTGLSWNGATAGIEAAEQRGLIHRIPESIPAEWQICFTDTPSVSEPPQPVRETPSASEGDHPQPVRDLKEINKEEITSVASDERKPEPQRRTAAKQKGDLLDGFLAYQQPAGKDSLEWVGAEWLRDRMRVFIRETGITPRQSERSFWVKELAQQVTTITERQMIDAIRKMRRDGLTIKSPASVFAIARDLPNTPQQQAEVVY